MNEPTRPGRGFWTISIIALLWNLIGVMTYLMTVTVSPETLDAMSEAERARYTDIPKWVTSVYAIAVFSGLLGSVGLLLRKAWAVPVLTVSLVTILVQMTYGIFLTPLIREQGAAAAALPVTIAAVGVYLVWFAASARKRGVLV